MRSGKRRKSFWHSKKYTGLARNWELLITLTSPKQSSLNNTPRCKNSSWSTPCHAPTQKILSKTWNCQSRNQMRMYLRVRSLKKGIIRNYKSTWDNQKILWSQTKEACMLREHHRWWAILPSKRQYTRLKSDQPWRQRLTIWSLLWKQRQGTTHTSAESTQSMSRTVRIVFIVKGKGLWWLKILCAMQLRFMVWVWSFI